METSVKRKTLSDTHYSSNYDEIYEIDSLEVNEQILIIDNELDIHLDSNSSNEMDYRGEIYQFFQDNGLVYSTSSYLSNNISSMVDFDILQSSFISLPSC